MVVAAFLLGGLARPGLVGAHEDPVSLNKLTTAPALEFHQRHAQHGRIKLLRVHRFHLIPPGAADWVCRPVIAQSRTGVGEPN